MRIKYLFAAVAICFGLSVLPGVPWLLAPGSGLAQASGLGDSLGLSPFWNWQTLETEHFRISYPEELHITANKIGNYLEEAHGILSKKLYWQPRFKTQIVVTDNADAANGLASATLRLGIVFQVTPPENWYSIAYYDDWLRILTFHEYTHILNMDATEGVVYDALRILFGDILLPNSIWPRWMLEGLAVYMETRLTHGGRGRSPYYEMILRAAAEKKLLDTPDFITLDKVNGSNPYFPGGETAYLFGYQLMNEVARNGDKRQLTRTHDGDALLSSGEDALGRMSIRSSRRVPFLINDNLLNITGKDWYDHWDDFIKITQERSDTALKKIATQPVTQPTLLTHSHYQAFLGALSPDGVWIASTTQGLDLRESLVLKNCSTGETRIVADKLFGVGMAFTPDSKTLIFSGVQRRGTYYLWSELGAYNLEKGTLNYFTDSLRGKDPDVSKDGQWVTFTLTDSEATTRLALAPLLQVNGEYRIGAVKTIFPGSRFDRVANPKFSLDGKHIVFSYHPNGKLREDLMQLDLETGAARAIVQNEKMNRYPAISPRGEIYFVSDLTGVDNVYRLRSAGKAEQVTNVTTGLWFPSFAPNGDLFASYFTPSGFELAQVELANQSINSESVSIEPPPAPLIDSDSNPKGEPEIQFKSHPYSAYPSILPRQWVPIFVLDQTSAYFGGEVQGFDATDRHRYIAAGAYDTNTKNLDWVALYANRSLGPTFTFLGTNEGQIETSGSSRGDHSFSLSVDYPFLWTHSSLVPSVTLKARQESDYDPSKYYGTLDARLNYSNTESSKLAVTSEEGRNTLIGIRYYPEPDLNAWKALFIDTEHFRVFGHSVLVPSIQASMVSRRKQPLSPSSVRLTSKPKAIFDTLVRDPLDELRIRGYSHFSFYTREAAVTALDYRFPLWHIYRGWGTHPVFLDNLSGFIFGENTYFPTSDISLPSAGGGIEVNGTVLVQFPIAASVEYDQGFRRQSGGRGEVLFKVGLGAINF